MSGCLREGSAGGARRPPAARALVAATVAWARLLGAASPAGAQDVELLGRMHGTRPPAGYYREATRDPQAFTFHRGVWQNRVRAMYADRGVGGAGAAVFGRRNGSVQGTFRMPLVLGLYADSPQRPPFSTGRVQEEFFDGPNSRDGTITEFYREISGGRVDLLGETHPWVRSGLSQAQVVGGVAGLHNPARTGEFIVQLLAATDDGSVDWGRYDNDGPDGVPNSGDDDGFVDVLAVMHPTVGAECQGADDRIWSHRWAVSAWMGSPYVTKSPSASGGRIRIDDYTIQPVLSCDGGVINEIGVFAHELGHGFGLPDLYDTNDSDGSHAGAGNWDLMGTGAWGCGAFDPSRPCHMGAWSKSVLGWVEIDTLETGVDYGLLSLEPVEAGGRVLRVPSGDGSGEYFLLENRERLGFDQDLRAPGLLVWQIDPDVVQAGGGVNSNRDHMGVWLRQADGRNDLATNGGGRGDDGDPFPGATGNTAFHAGSNPGSWSHQRRATGVTLLEITLDGFLVRARTLTRFQDLALRVQGAEGAGDVFKVDGEVVSGAQPRIASAPFQERVVEAAEGIPLQQGIRTAFAAWEDGSDRVRVFTTGLRDSTLVASYADREVLLDLSLESPVGGIPPGALTLSPLGADGWFPEGATVRVEARARTGFSFREWSGDLAGRGNPLTLTLDGPRSGAASFDVTYGVAEVTTVVRLEAATESRVGFETHDANPPVSWSVTGGDLPAGLRLGSDGVIAGAPLESGTFEVEVTATDAIGLEASAALTLEVAEPGAGMETLAAPFLLTVGGPSAALEAFLDRHGNGNGRYDVGDLRAHLQRHPELPVAGTLGGGLFRTVVALPRGGPREEGRP